MSTCDENRAPGGEMPIWAWGSDEEQAHGPSLGSTGQAHMLTRPPCPLSRPPLSVWNANSLAICLLSLPACPHRPPRAAHKPWCT